MIRVDGFKIENRNFRTLKFVKEESDELKESKIINPMTSLLIHSKDFLVSHKRCGYIVMPKELPVFDKDLIKNSIQKIPTIILTDEQVKNLENNIKFKNNKSNTKKVELEIETDEADDILLGELDYFLSTHFKLRRIIVGGENISYLKK